MNVKFDGRSVTAMGWGDTKENSGLQSDYLRSASLDVISNAKCSKIYGVMRDSEFCAYKEGKGTCQVSDIFSYDYQSQKKVDAGRFYRETAAAPWSPITDLKVSIADSFRLASSALDLVRVI